MEIDINFLAWELVICHLARGGGEGEFCWGIIIKIFVGFRGSVVDKESLPGGARSINLMKEVRSSNN